MGDVFALGGRLDGGAKGINQAVMDPGWIAAAWIHCQGFAVYFSAFTRADQLTPDIDWTGVALSLRTAGGSELAYDLIDRYRAELDGLIGN